MSQAAAINTRRSLSVADINSEFDGQPRMLDLRLAEALGFKKPNDIRPLISRHLQALGRFGEVFRMARKTTNKGGRPTTESYLNKKQALYICTKSDTDNATEVTIQMVEVFDAFTSGNPVSVRAHDRRTSTKIDDALKLKRNIDRLESVVEHIAPKPQNVCAMIIDGEHVWVDINKYDGAGRAVVIEHNGAIRIQEVEAEYIGHRPFGARTALGERYRSPHGGVARNSVAVIGMVMGAERPASTDTVRTIEHLAGERKGRFKDEILRLLPTGMSTVAITRRVGCSREAVQYWRRRVSA